MRDESGADFSAAEGARLNHVRAASTPPLAWKLDPKFRLAKSGSLCLLGHDSKGAHCQSYRMSQDRGTSNVACSIHNCANDFAITTQLCIQWKRMCICTDCRHVKSAFNERLTVRRQTSFNAETLYVKSEADCIAHETVSGLSL